MPEMTPVNSSMIRAVGYGSATERLKVEFSNGTRWVYEGVPERVYDSLLSAHSIGSFFIKNIKGKFEGYRL